MKKGLLLILSIIYCFSGKAGSSDSSWVDCPEGRIIVRKITFTDNKAVLILTNGKKMILPHNQISTFFSDNKTFKRLPLYKDGKQTGEQAFMELVKYEGEFELYRYCDWSYNPNLKITVYLLYKGDGLVMEFDEKSHP